MNTLTIATRQSPLALWQAYFVKDELQKLYPKLDIHLLELVTKGDKILDTPLAKIGGKGLFVKELETALLSGKADIAVHSLKDVPMVLPDGLIIGAYLDRHSPFDAFVSNHFHHLDELPQGAKVGTSSLRRECQLRAYRPDLQIISLRGNVGTRLGKLDNGDYDAIILAQSGLERLELHERIRHSLSIGMCLPAVGQGTLAIECRDDGIKEFIRPLNHKISELQAITERAMNHALDGGCQVPIAGFAQLDKGVLSLEGRVGTSNGRTLLKVTNQTDVTDNATQNTQNAQRLGKTVAIELLNQGADSILRALYQRQDR